MQRFLFKMIYAFHSLSSCSLLQKSLSSVIATAATMYAFHSLSSSLLQKSLSSVIATAATMQLLDR
jgi:hypothetical protein